MDILILNFFIFTRLQNLSASPSSPKTNLVQHLVLDGTTPDTYDLDRRILGIDPDTTGQSHLPFSYSGSANIPPRSRARSRASSKKEYLTSR